MFRWLLRDVQCSGGPILPLDLANHDKVSKDIKTAKDFDRRRIDTETGKDRLWMMFSTEYVTLEQRHFLSKLFVIYDLK